MHQNNTPPPTAYTPRHQSSRPQHNHDRYRTNRSGDRNNHRKKMWHNARTPYSDHKEGRARYEDPRDRFQPNKDDYFSNVQDNEETESNQDVEGSNKEDALDDEDDPLDAYMRSLESSAANPSSTANETQGLETRAECDTVSQEAIPSSSTMTFERGVRLDIDDTDDAELDYLNKRETSMRSTSELGDEFGASSQDDEDRQHIVEYDRYDNITSVRRIKRDVEPLPSIDHSTINYDPFERNFYKVHPEIDKLSQEMSEELRTKLEIKVSGESPPKPVCSFAHFNFDEKLMKVIRRSEYTQPTPIQAQAIPAALSGRNLIGIALTGSGKTAAYLWPMIVHIMGQPNLRKGDGPIGLVLVPTRELALQVYGQAKKFSHSYNIAVVCAYGGGSKYEQSKDLEAGAEIVVATPGRLIDLIKVGTTNLKRVTYLVLDEADRFFEMGFEAQVRSICDYVRPERQTLLFSATFRHKTEQLARKIVDNPVKIVQRNLGEVNEDVKQFVITFTEGSKKWDWLTSKLVEFTSSGSVLIFVTRIVNAEELHKNLCEHGIQCLLLHGDMDQSERNHVISSFKKKEKDIMIATDVAARGLDISHIRTVVNYDVARDIDTHIHRVGRTGRAGLKGDAYTLITDKEKDFAGFLVKNLESSKQEVGDDLMKIAMQSHSFRRSRSKTSHNHHGGDHHSRGKHHHYNKDSSNHHHSQQFKRTTYQNHGHGHGHGHSNRSFNNDDKKRTKWY